MAAFTGAAPMSDKSELPRSATIALAQHADAIRAAGRRTIENVVDIGRHLVEAKRLCGHGNWLPWLEREFGWSEDTAERYMKLADDRFRKLRNLSLPVSCLYLLTAPGTPPEVRQSVIKRAASGEKISHAEIKAAVGEARHFVKPSKKLRNAAQQLIVDIAPPVEPTEAEIIAQIIDLFKRLDRHAQNRCQRKLLRISNGDA
jgi:hypothetical protein